MSHILNFNLQRVPSGLSTAGSAKPWRLRPSWSLFRPPAQDRALKLGLFALWLCCVGLMASRHAFFRDEVRALSLALSGKNVIEMFNNIRGEGHPALWYLLLRFGYFVVGSPIVLPVTSVVVAAAAALILVLRAPFSWWFGALLLVSNFLSFDYSVMARNYGISALLMFLLANFYERYREHGILLGTLLFLLANSNAHSVFLVGAFLLYWLIDIVGESGFRWSPAFKTLLMNAAISMAGVALCIATIYPPFNDAAVAALPDGVTLKLLGKAILLPAASFHDLLPDWARLSPLLSDRSINALISLVMFGSLLGLVQSPGAFIAALTALITLSLFFTVVYGGEYRHEALWLVFVITLYWIVQSRNKDREPSGVAALKPFVGPASTIGSSAIVLLMLLQPFNAGRGPLGSTGSNGGLEGAIANIAFGGPPLSRARDFGALLAKRSDLKNAIIIADPDFLVEPLPYYVQNATYLIRERRFGNFVRFTKAARLSIDLEDILTTAKTLRTTTGRPVLILLYPGRLDPSRSQTYHEGINWTLNTTPEQVNAFKTATRFLAVFAPALSDESFEVYLFDHS